MAATDQALRLDAIGLPEVLFQSITDMAPGAAIAAWIPAGAPYAPRALPPSAGRVRCLPADSLSSGAGRTARPAAAQIHNDTQEEHSMTPITYRSTDVKGLKVFYRESGPSDAPKLLLLHGFPSAGHMFRDLIPQLADRFHVAAPDLIGFGQSDMPGRDSFTYTFEALTDVIEGFTDAVGFDR
jgi:hypothetical protein